MHSESKKTTVTVVKVDSRFVHYYGEDGVVNRRNKENFHRGMMRAGSDEPWTPAMPGCEVEWVETPDRYEDE